MSKIFDDDSDSEVELKTDNEYAKNYDNWRKKEEFNKLKTKYGEELLEDSESSSSSEDDEEGIEFTEEVEKQFFKTLSYLKNKDPRIYNDNIQFFDSTSKNEQNKKKKKKEKPMYIGDYERELILKENGELSENEEADGIPRSMSPTYVEEQNKLKESFKKILNQVSDDENEDGSGMLQVRQKTEEEKVKEDADYREWLAGQKEQIDDKDFESDLKSLKDYWNKPNLDDGEKFLRDYILKKRYLANEDEDYIPTYEEIIHDSDKDLSEDEDAIEKQEEFEHKYNFRFEEPDQEFIKRYPRTLEHSLRKTDDRRKLKRAETKERKQKEKEQKMQELKKLQELKKKEIEEKIEKLKEITGNDDIQFNDEDLEGDFDPEAHDKKMQSLFNDEFYAGHEHDQKPEFPELDEYLEIENWEKWNGEKNQETEEYEPHCEDDDFNMDCDYDPQAEMRKELIENTKPKKKRKRKSLFAKAVATPKPAFDPNDTTYEEYLDEYYKFDCEDIVGDVPCRFKYRKVVPNDFGLTVEEILKANDRELNKWCSLKKAVQIRPDHVEKYDQIAYSKKAKNLELKKKILPSLFEDEKSELPEQTETSVTKKKKKNKKVKCNKLENNIQIRDAMKELDGEDVKKESKQTIKENIAADMKEKVVTNVGANIKRKKKKKKNAAATTTYESSNNKDGVKKRKLSVSASNNDIISNKKRKKTFKNKEQEIGISDARLSAYGLNPKKFKNKLKYKKQ